MKIQANFFMLIIALMLVLQQGCASNASIKNANVLQSADYETIVMAYDCEHPDIKLSGVYGDDMPYTFKWFGQGFAYGFGGCVYAGFMSMTTLIGFLLIYFSPYCGAAGAAIGGVSGALWDLRLAVPSSAEKGVGTLATEATASSPDEDLSLRVMNSAPAELRDKLQSGGELCKQPKPDELTASGINAVLVTDITSLNFLRIHGAAAIQLEAKASLISAGNDNTIERDFQCSGPFHIIEEWTENGEEILRQEIPECLDTIAASISDYFLANNHNMDDSVNCSLKPIYNGVVHTAQPDRPFEINTLKPTLGWDAFPRDNELLGAKSKREIVSDVTYQLTLYDETGNTVYDKKKIETTEHTVDKKLAPNSSYSWSVTPTFNIYGTDWETMKYMPREVKGIPFCKNGKARNHIKTPDIKRSWTDGDGEEESIWTPFSF